MKTIFKYTLTNGGSNIIDLPKGFKLLSVVEQYNQVVFYGIVNVNEEETEQFEFVVKGTGTPFDINEEDYIFLNTVKLFEGELMFHIFYRKL